MGFRFRKSIGILPGIRLNLSKTGVSTSLGGPGATVNLRGDRVKTTVGLPGTGLSYSEEESLGEGSPAGRRRRAPGRSVAMGLAASIAAGVLAGLFKRR